MKDSDKLAFGIITNGIDYTVVSTRDDLFSVGDNNAYVFSLSKSDMIDNTTIKLLDVLSNDNFGDDNKIIEFKESFNLADKIKSWMLSSNFSSLDSFSRYVASELGITDNIDVVKSVLNSNINIVCTEKTDMSSPSTKVVCDNIETYRLSDDVCSSLQGLKVIDLSVGDEQLFKDTRTACKSIYICIQYGFHYYTY